MPKQETKQEISFESDDEFESKNNDENEWKGEAMELRDQILHRPDTYIGATINEERIDYIYSDEDEKIISKNITGNRGLERFIEEILSNVIDNKTRSEDAKIKMNTIKVKFEKVKNNNVRFTVWNDGKTIPIKLFKNTGKYNPEMAFFTLLVSD
jgi:DNA gyrase/topoisomerase IV subunit B